MFEAFVRSHPALLRWAYFIYRGLRPLREHPLAGIRGYFRLFRDWRRFRALSV